MTTCQTLRNVTTCRRHSEISSSASPYSVHAGVQTLHTQKHSMETSYQSAAFVPVHQTTGHYVHRNLVSVVTILMLRTACDKVPPAGMWLTCNVALYICFSIKAQASCHESQRQYHPLGHRLSRLAGRGVVGPLSHRSVRRAISHTASVNGGGGGGSS